MRQSTTIILLAVLTSNVYAAPQFLTFKDGKIGVNFAGYHAAAGLGGILGGDGGGGAGGRLFAEAGTPFGQSARAGLGGAVDANGGSSGGLYAGATAGGNVKAAAGLAGGVTAEKSSGNGYAEAQAGNRYASSGLGGHSSVEGSSGFTFSGSKSFGISSGVVKQTEVQPVQTVEVIQPVEVVKPIEVVKSAHKKVHAEVNVDANNEVVPLPLAHSDVGYKAQVGGGINVKAEAPPTVIVKEVYVQPPPATYVEKQVYRTHYKPHRHHLRKHAYIGGYIGGAGGVDVPAPPPPPPQPAPVYHKYVAPVIEKRVDIGAESALSAGAGGHVNTNVGGGGGGEFGYTKQVTFQRNPTFFADIFNIPISTLKAVGNFLGNTAGSTSVSVQKSASVHADSESVSSKHVPTSSASSDTVVSVQTPTVSKFIDDIFAIPINTLGAVNKFLENNVPARKNVQVDGEPTRVRLGPHARRRANKQVVIVQESPDTLESEFKKSE